jgi:dephospho-CoA kinase
MSVKRPLNIGLTGNIGSGKSTVARLLVEKGAALIDADALARAATKEPEILERIAKDLGADLITQGQLDRAKTAALVFKDEGARQKLNAIIHPWVREKTAEKLQEYRQCDPAPDVIVQDIPLLFENNLEAGLDGVIVVYAPLELRLERLKLRSGLTEDAALARDKAQMPLEEKVKRATYIIDNSGSFEALKEQVEALWIRLLEATQSFG